MNENVRQRIDALIPLLKDSKGEVRTAVAEAIERLEASGDLNEILHTLRTGDMGARISAIYALGEIGGDRVLNPLIYCAGRQEDDIRAAAVEMLGQLARPAALPVLLERLKDLNAAVQARAIAALGNFPATDPLCCQLRPFLESDNSELEAEAALALARLGDTAATAGIISLLSSPHTSTRKAAATALSLLPL